MNNYKEKEKTYVVEIFGNRFFNIKSNEFTEINFEDENFILTSEQVIRYFSNYDENHTVYTPLGISETCHIGGENKGYFIHGRKSYSQFIIEQIKNS